MTQEIKFEKAMERLEQIVRLLEDGNTPLDESIRLYEEGIGLVRLCSERLESAQQKIVSVGATGDGGNE